MFSQFRQIDEVQIDSFIYKQQTWINREKLLFMVICRFNPQSYCRAHFARYGIYLPPSLSFAVEKRQLEFLAGRYAARQAIGALCDGTIEVPDIAVGHMGAPLWPNELTGSISHSAGVAVCVVAKKEDTPFIGIDVETCVNAEEAQQIAGLTANQFEQRVLEQYAFELKVGTTLLFSAKESLFKAICPFLHRYLEFDSARLIELDPAKGRLKLQLSESLRECNLPSVYDCWYQVAEGRVWTLVSSR